MPTSPRNRVPVLLCIDVEPEGRAIDPAERVEWDGFEQAFEYFARLRPRFAAATGAPVHFSWFLRMDPQIERVYGSAAWVGDRYRGILRELEEAGDEIGLHCHPWRWDERERHWVAEFGDQRWIDHCVRTGFAAFGESLGRPCRSFRFGDRWMNDATLDLVEELGGRFDLTVEPGSTGPILSEPFTGRLPDYASAPRVPYRPSRRDFRRSGLWPRRRLWEIPLTTGRLDWAFEALASGVAPEREEPGAGAAYEGWHDLTDDEVIAGWAFDASRPDRIVTVEIQDGETLLARVDAGSFRADLLAARKGDGRHAFELPIPERLRDGNLHQIAVRIAGTDLALGGTPHELRSHGNGSAASPFLTFFVAFNPPILRGLIETVLDRQASRYLAMILRASLLLPEERARVGQNFEYLLCRPDVDRMLIATPAEAIALLEGNRLR